MKRTIGAAVALSGALALAGCGSSGTTTTTQQVAASATASATSSATPTASPSSTTSAGAIAPGATIDATELGTRMSAAMVAAKTGKGTLSMSGSGVSMNGTSSFVYTSPTQADTQASMSMMGLNLEVRSIGGTLYMRGLPTQMTGGKEWVKVDPNGTDAMSKAMREAGGGSGDPQNMVDALKGGKATVVDSAEGNTHYKITGLSAAGAADTTMDLTVDSKGLPVTSVVEASGAKVTVTYTEWGTPVTVAAPPADQVGTMSVPKT